MDQLYFQEGLIMMVTEEELKKIFDDKMKRRKLAAQRPVEEKFRELIKMQEILVNANPKYKNSKIIPWKIS